MDINDIMSAAEKGDPTAQCRLGSMYQSGEVESVKKNLKTAFDWYEKSANLRNSDGQWHLAFMYLYGQGVAKDLKKALDLYKKSAEQKNPEGEWRVSWMHQFGLGVEGKLKTAFDGNKESPDQGTSDLPISA